jgi:hypothetical protein
MEEFQAMDNLAARFFSGNTVTQSRKREPRGMYSTLSAHNIVSVVISEPEQLEQAGCQMMDITLIAENGERIRMSVFGENIQVTKDEHENPSAA